MKWKLVGERTILAAFPHTREGVAEEDPNETITRKVPVMKWDYNTPGWKGARWASTNWGLSLSSTSNRTEGSGSTLWGRWPCARFGSGGG